MFRLRASVWIGEGADPTAFPGGEWRNERDASRLHWIVLDGDRVVATASLGICAALADVEEGDAYVRAGLSSPGPVAAPARVTVAADCRGRGLVQDLLNVQDAAAVEAGAVLAVRQASPSMRPLLERRGWQAHGPGPWDARFPVQFTIMSLTLRR
jgi:hypothetical protein